MLLPPAWRLEPANETLLRWILFLSSAPPDPDLSLQPYSTAGESLFIRIGKLSWFSFRSLVFSGSYPKQGVLDLVVVLDRVRCFVIILDGKINQSISDWRAEWGNVVDSECRSLLSGIGNVRIFSPNTLSDLVTNSGCIMEFWHFSISWSHSKHEDWNLEEHIVFGQWSQCFA